MKQKKKIPFEAIMTIVVLGLIAVMAIDGFAVEHMPADRSVPNLCIRGHCLSGDSGAGEYLPQAEGRQGRKARF